MRPYSADTVADGPFSINPAAAREADRPPSDGFTVRGTIRRRISEGGSR